MLAARGIDQVRQRVVAGRSSGPSNSHGRQVGGLAGHDRADARLQPERAAPPSVAARSAACAGIACGVAAPPPWRAAPRVRISWNRSRRLLLAAPSVPSATLMPAASSGATGAKPLASFRLDDGQCATEAAVLRQQGDLAVVEVHRMHRDQARARAGPRRAQALAAGARRARRPSARSRPRVSCRWMCTGRSSSAASVAILRKVASDTV